MISAPALAVAAAGRVPPFFAASRNKIMAPILKLDECDRVIELDEGRGPSGTDAFFPANIHGILSLRRR